MPREFADGPGQMLPMDRIRSRASKLEAFWWICRACRGSRRGTSRSWTRSTAPAVAGKLAAENHVVVVGSGRFDRSGTGALSAAVTVAPRGKGSLISSRIEPVSRKCQGVRAWTASIASPSALEAIPCSAKPAWPAWQWRAGPAWGQTMIDLALPGGPSERPITTAFPQKGAMILQRTRPPLLETPFEVFDKGVFTPNDQFYVRWHWAVIPTEVDVDSFRLRVHGHVDKAMSPGPLGHPVPCRGWSWRRSINARAIRAASSSRASPAPNGPTAPWAMPSGPGVRLRDVLDRAGVKAGAVQVRLEGHGRAGGARARRTS